MGANAQIAVPAFTAGQVLTATQQTQINTGIPVFATTTTRDAAFGGTGKKVLAQGQTCYIEATSTYQTYNGSAWVTFGAGGLTCVRAETSFSAVSTVTADSVFSSSYTNYLILFSATQSNIAGIFSFQFRASGATNATANYASQHNYITTSLVASRNTGTGTAISLNSDLGVNGQVGAITVYNPNLAETTQITHSITPTSPSSITEFGAGGFGLTNVFDGFVLSVSPGTITGKYSVYGYNKAA